MNIYLASPLGFSPEQDGYRKRITVRLEEQGHTVFDPWEQHGVNDRIATALSNHDSVIRHQSIQEVAAYAGKVNTGGIVLSDALLAVLDGAEPDAGTVSELGYAAGLGKPCYGLRTDIREMGELPGLPINLQVLHFIHASGGQLFRTIDETIIPQKGRKGEGEMNGFDTLTPCLEVPADEEALRELAT